MRLSRSTISFLSKTQEKVLSPVSSSRRLRLSLLSTVAITMSLVAAIILPGLSSTAQARSYYAPAGQASASFLTLPFTPTPRMSILSGWYYSGGAGFHGGIDYINGNVNNLNSWQTFPVIAAADGEACGNCSSRQGNAVWIKHSVNGHTYYTYYGHLASISLGIPRGSQSRTVHVKRGQVVGMAGDTGVGSGVLHLHFGLYNANSTPLDPYSIGKLREYYPRPSVAPSIGWFLNN